MGTINDEVISNYVNPQNSSDVHTESLNSILLGFHQKKVSLAQFVQMLGTHLTNLDELVRSRGTLLLAEVLTRLPTYPLDANAVHFLVGFFCDRIQDYPCVGEVLKGLLAIVVNHQLGEADPELIVRTIFQEVQPQSLPQSRRKMVFDIIQILLNKHLPALQALQSDFVFGILQVIDGEKDPRNLMVAFQIFVKTIKNVPGHSRFTEDLFEVVSCYFPITFTPRADDPDSISKEVLVSALRACLHATPDFAQFCIPFLLDKLASSSTDAKIESMLTLEECCQSFGSNVILKYLPDIWGALRAEVLTGKEAVVVDQGLSSIKAITKILSSDLVTTSDGSSALHTFLTPLITDSVKQLGGLADSKLASTSSKILAAAASASLPACVKVCDTVLPQITTQLLSSEEIYRQSLLDVLPALISASKTAVPAGTSAHPLAPHTKDIYENLSSSLIGGTPATRTTAVLGLTGLSLLSGSFNLLPADSLTAVCARITTVAIDDTDADVRRRSVESLVALARASPQTVQQHALPLLLRRVSVNTAAAINQPATQAHDTQCRHDHKHDHHGHSHDHAHDHADAQLFEAIASLCVAPAIYDTVTKELLSMIQTMLRDDAKLSACDPPLHDHPAHVGHHGHEYNLRSHQVQAERVFKCLADAIVHNSPDKATVAQLCTSLIPSLLSILIEHVTTVPATLPPHGFHRSIELYLPHCLRVARTAAQKAEEDVQLELFNVVTDIFLTGKSALPTFKPTSTDAPQNQQQLIVLYCAIISQAKLSTLSSLPVLNIVTALLALTTVPIVASSAAQCVASLINKVPEGEFLSRFLDEIVDKQLVAALESKTAEPALRESSLRTLVWVLKALLQRDHPTWRGLVAMVINLVGFPGGQEGKGAEVAEIAANAFDILLAEVTKEGECLTKSSGAVVKVLYKQKFFTVVYPQLLESFKTTSSHLYLVAIANLLRHVPRPVLLAELPTIIPLLIQSLRHPSASSTEQHVLQQAAVLQTSSTSTILMLLKEAPASIESHASTLINLLLNLATESPFVDVRTTSLQCIAKFASLPYITIFPHKGKVVKTLQKTLDDKKRVVRREAVKARNQWFVLAENAQPGHGHHGHAH